MAAPKEEVQSGSEGEKVGQVDSNTVNGSIQSHDAANTLRRHLGGRQITMIAIGGSIGTALFISIGSGLAEGGPAGLLLAYGIYCCILATVNNSMAEMAVYMPISGTFIRFAGKWVDEAFGFMAGWNFFFYEAFLIPFEISALNLVLKFWRDDIPAGAVCAACIVLYALLNIVAVKYFGEAEFWLSTGKVLLIFIVFSFTFVTMVGGNPQHDHYGFRYWYEPGAFAEYITTGTLGRFEGFLNAFYGAAFTIVGPEYLAMVAGEAKHPRTYLKNGFKTIFWRFGFFFIGSAIAVGVVLPFNDPNLGNGSSTANASPYVIAMQNMGITILPDITCALLVTTIFSAGNSYTYCAMRSLYGLALEGQAPPIFKKCTKQGIPYWAFTFTMIFPLLSLLALSNSTNTVVTWFSLLTEGAQLIDYIIISVTYIFFHRAMKAQGIDRNTLPYRGYLQPYCGWIGAIMETMILGSYGYSVFLPGRWDIATFFAHYTMVFVAIITFTGWKIFRRTKVVKPLEADLVWERPIIDAYEESEEAVPPSFWEEVRELLRIKQRKVTSPEDSA